MKARRFLGEDLWKVAEFYQHARGLTALDKCACMITIGVAQVPLQGASDHIVSDALYLVDPDGNRSDVYADRADAAGTRIGLDEHTPVLRDPWATTTAIEQ